MRIFNHFRLAWRLMFDRRVSIWIKALIVGLPAVYAAIPMALEIPDYLPLVGLLDDVMLLAVASVVFVVASPPQLVRGHRLAIQSQMDRRGDAARGLDAPNGHLDLEVLRHPQEINSLAVGLGLVVALLLAAGNTVGMIWLASFGIGYLATRLERGRMLANAIKVTARQFPKLNQAYLAAQRSLPGVQLDLFVVQDPRLNAFTYGYREPYSLVVTSGLVEKLSQEEIQAVIGHEMGHILFQHTLLIYVTHTSILGVEQLLFPWWSRSCEYSADAVAWQASGQDARTVASALIKIGSGLVDLPVDIDEFLAQVQEGDQAAVRVVEWLSTHPMIHNRVRRLLELDGDLEAEAGAPDGGLEAEAAAAL